MLILLPRGPESDCINIGWVRCGSAAAEIGKTKTKTKKTTKNQLGLELMVSLMGLNECDVVAKKANSIFGCIIRNMR